ncbi:hypothetical protein HGB13_05035 [bacterium]|nr:hypothetical protein [bacterium]
MSEKKKLQIVVLSYNRINSLKNQINEFKKLGYIGHSQIDFVIQDNDSTDGPADYINELKDSSICFRELAFNMGYGNSYVKAHELCVSDFLWIVGDDTPLIDVETLLIRVSDFGNSLIYSVFGSSTLPVIPKKYLDGLLYKDFVVADLLGITSSSTSLFGGFVSGVIWNHKLIKNVVIRYKQILKNNELVSHSPQVYIAPLFLMNSDDVNAVQKYFFRVHCENIVSAPKSEQTQMLDANSKKNSIDLKGFISKIFRSLKNGYGCDLLSRGCIWIHVSLFIGDFYRSSDFSKNYSKNHLYPMAYHFSVLYKLSNYRLLVMMFIRALMRCVGLKSQPCVCSQLDASILLYRLIACQIKGIELRKW